MKLKTGSKVAAVLIGAASLTLAIPVMPAVGQSSPPSGGIRLQPTGQVVNKGAVALVSVLIACPAGDDAQVSVQLSERSGHEIAQGFSSTFAICSGGIQTLSLAVTPNVAPFVAGTAYGQAQLFDCSFFGCIGSSDQGNVKLSKK